MISSIYLAAHCFVILTVGADLRANFKRANTQVRFYGCHIKCGLVNDFKSKPPPVREGARQKLLGGFAGKVHLLLNRSLSIQSLSALLTHLDVLPACGV